MTMRILLVIAAGVFVAACGGGTTTTDTASNASAPAATAPAATSPASSTSAVASTEATAPDPCGLLDRSEVEAVTGPLAGPPFRTRESSDNADPVQNGDACVYQTPDFRSIRIAVAWKDGAAAFKAISFPAHSAPGGLHLAGTLDEAQSLGCCEIFALRDDRLVTFDYRGWRADTERAVGMLNTALARLDHPLPLDGNAGNQDARQRAAERPRPRIACSLLSRDEAETIVGPLLADPHTNAKDENLNCIYRYTLQASKDSPSKTASGPAEANVDVHWRGGFEELNDATTIASTVGGKPGTPKRTLGKVDGPWDEGNQTAVAFTAVKDDVAITIDTDPTLSMAQVDLRRKMVAAMIEKLASKE
jgi:hypothetical protein